MLKLGWIAPAAALAALGGCVVVGGGERESRTYDMTGFDSISATSGINVVLKQGPFAVSAEAPKGKLDRITIERDGSTLKLGEKPDMVWFGWSGPSIVTVTAPDYASIDASGGADVDVRSLKLDALNITAHGGADINADSLALDTLGVNASGGADINVATLALDKLTVAISGGADLRLSGSCKSLQADVSSGADLKGGGLTCENAVVMASGGGDADVTVTASASGKAGGGADINFHGNPKTLNREESGGGDVNVASN